MLEGPRGFGDSNGLVVFDVTPPFFFCYNLIFIRAMFVDHDRLESESNRGGCGSNSETAGAKF